MTTDEHRINYEKCSKQMRNVEFCVSGAQCALYTKFCTETRVTALRPWHGSENIVIKLSPAFVLVDAFISSCLSGNAANSWHNNKVSRSQHTTFTYSVNHLERCCCGPVKHHFKFFLRQHSANRERRLELPCTAQLFEGITKFKLVI